MVRASPPAAGYGLTCLVAAAFTVTLVWRFLTFTGFTNDHYAHLALAQQWLLGERPVRDFTDPGWPLTYLLSAAAWRLAGNTMWVEWTIVSTALASAAACTAVAAHRLSGSLLIAAAVTALEILIFPRTYSYPKILMYAVAACAMIAVAARPSRQRAVVLAAVVAIAFLFRHDHGLYIGAGAVVCVALVGPFGLSDAARRAGLLVAATAAFLLPWMSFIALNGGLPAYFETALEFARAEANASNLRSWPRLTLVPGQPIAGLAPPDRPLVQVEWIPEMDAALRRALEARYGLALVRESEDGAFYYVHNTSADNLERLGDDPHVAGATGLGRVNRPAWRELLATVSPLRLAPALHSAANADAWLFWLFWSLPLLCAGMLAFQFTRGSERWPGQFALISALIVVSLFVNAGFLRDVLRTRFSDAVVLPAVLGAWVLGIVWIDRWKRGSWQRAARGLSLAMVLITWASATAVAETGERLELTGVNGGIQAMRARAAAVAGLLANPHRQTLAPPSRRSEALMPFFGYLDRCTTLTDRLIVTGESPDVVVLSGRGFASDGAVFGAWYSSAAHQDRTLERLRERPALFVLLMDPGAFRARFPAIDSYVTDSYRKMVDVPVEGAEPVPILVLRSRRADRVDRETGWPCFARSG